VSSQTALVTDSHSRTSAGTELQKDVATTENARWKMSFLPWAGQAKNLCLTTVPRRGHCLPSEICHRVLALSAVPRAVVYVQHLPPVERDPVHDINTESMRTSVTFYDISEYILHFLYI